MEYRNNTEIIIIVIVTIQMKYNIIIIMYTRHRCLRTYSPLFLETIFFVVISIYLFFYLFFYVKWVINYNNVPESIYRTRRTTIAAACCETIDGRRGR